MELKKITSEKEYNAALERFEEIMFAEEKTLEDSEAFVLGLIIEAYEEENFPIEEPDPIEYIDARLDALGLKRKDLVGVIATSEA
ncbi:MAG: type II toxin-antitoxin system HigA family antitoxin, partial [Cryomorphaceae bacterium]